MKVTLKVWKQNGKNGQGELKSYESPDVSPDCSFLEMLDLVNNGLESRNEEPIGFDSDCREGICGTCGMVINGVAHGPGHGTATCQLYMRQFKDGDVLTLEPWRATAFPVVKDLVGERSAFDLIIQGVCYISVGTLENWRPDARLYDPMVLGNPYGGFEDERWIDIRQLSKVAPLFEFRMDMCKAKGFDAIEFDNMDAWYADNKTGLNITKADSVAFVRYLAREAHERGMSMALKSVVEMVPDVRDHVDFSVVEECFENQECTRSSPNTDGQYGYDMMIEIGKPVFATEYDAFSASNNACAE